MKFALTGVGSGSTVRPEPLIRVAQTAESLGFESLWIPEHLALPVTMDSPIPTRRMGNFPAARRRGYTIRSWPWRLSRRTRKRFSSARASSCCRCATRRWNALLKT